MVTTITKIVIKTLPNSLDTRIGMSYVMGNRAESPPTERQNMKQAVVEVADLSSIVLTQNGAVVGYVTIKNVGSAGDIEFCGKAVNVYSFPKAVTYHGFACGSAITTDTPDEVVNVDNFNKAMVEVSK